MRFGCLKYFVILVATGLCFFSRSGWAVFFEPGAGLGLEYTDNATLVEENKLNDLILISYVGARLFEEKGVLTYDAKTSFNNLDYTQNTFDDQRYFNLAAIADWAMIKDRFNWFVSDTFGQSSVVAINSNTPDNLQNTNIFTFRADMFFPVSSRQSFSLTPKVTQYYYELLLNDNNQFSLAANWSYQMFRLTNVGLNFNTRKINYTEKNISGRSITDVTFTTMAVAFNGQRLSSSFSSNLGATNVKREDGQDTGGFTGFLNWKATLSSRSNFETLVSTDITDTSSVSSSVVGNDVQITTDVVRSSAIYLVYSREGSYVNTLISTRYNKLKYSDNPLDRITRDFNIQLSYSVTPLLTSGTYVNYNRTKLLDIKRLDKRVTVGANLKYQLSRKLKAALDLKFRSKESTLVTQNYNEVSIFASVVYGFGNVKRPSRTGGY